MSSIKSGIEKPGNLMRDLVFVTNVDIGMTSAVLRLRRKSGLVLVCVVLLLTSFLLFMEVSRTSEDGIISKQHRVLAWRHSFEKEFLVNENQDSIAKIDPHVVERRRELSYGENLQYKQRDHAWIKGSNGSECPWVKLAPKPPYFLTAVLLVRIYEADKAKLTTAELKMWLQYLRYAGVEHVYIYDAWVHSNESQLPKLSEFVKDSYITYVDWHTHNPYTIYGTQVLAYQNCIDIYKGENQWQIAIDIDEYPFSPIDQSHGFLSRYMQHFSESHSEVSEVTMQNFIFLGKPLDKELMIERLMRRTPRPTNSLVKPIYKPRNVHASIHHNTILSGQTVNAPMTELRMNHYWGARLQNWGEDTPKILELTEVDKGMEPIIYDFKQCEKLVRHYL